MQESQLLNAVGQFYGEVYSQVMRFMPRIVGLVENQYDVSLNTAAVEELNRRVVHATLCSVAGELQRNEFVPGAMRYYVDDNGGIEAEIDDKVDPILGWISIVDDRGILKEFVTEPLPSNNYLE